MLARVSVMFVIIAVLCATAFTLGRGASRQGDSISIPAQHPVLLALSHQQELGLSADQVQQLEALRVGLTQDFAPFKAQAEALQQRMQALQQSGTPDADAAQKIKQESDELGANLKPLFERYAKSAIELLTPEQRDKLSKLAGPDSAPSGDDPFLLMRLMQSRDQLGITPQQFTKLMYLQADFIRAFAPLREKMELLQIEVQEKFVKAGKEPPAEDRALGESIQKQVSELQTQFSQRAITDVLEPSQKAKVEELLHGEHRSAPSGG